MGPFDRGFEDALELRPGELVRWTGPGMHRVGRVWVGGRIYVSDQRLFFCPGVLARRRYGVLRLPLSKIAEVDLVSRRLALDAVAQGGLKPHVRVTATDGQTHALTMQRFARRAAELEAVLSGGGSADS